MTAAARRLALLATILVAAGAGSSTYNVRWGDTLSGIARRFGVPVSSIVAQNGIANPDRVREGTKLVIPDRGAARVAAAKPIAAATGQKVHNVARGETLSSIARRYRVSVPELRSLNSITNDRRVREGRTLVLPSAAVGATTAKASSAARRPAPLCPVRNAGKFDFSNSFGAPRHGGRSHAGNDIFAKRGATVVAPMGGSLRRADGARAGLAFYIDGDDGVTYYGAHLDAVSAPTGRVERGQVLGKVGTTGNAQGTPPHLHFEVKPGGGASIDPYGYLRTWCRGSGA